MSSGKYNVTKKLLNEVTAPGAGDSQPGHANAIFQLILTGESGALHATVDIETTEEKETVLDADAHWVWVATITLDVAAWATAADDATDSFLLKPDLGRVRGNVTALTGTGAAATLLMGV